MGIDAEQAARTIEHELRRVGTAERAEGQKRYLKSDLEHLGTTVGENRRVVGAFAQEHPDLDRAQLEELVRRLWPTSVFECRSAATLLLARYSRLLGRGELGFLQELVRNSHTWALVDPLAGDVLGSLALRDPGLGEALGAWARDEDFWVRRAALLSCLRPLRHGHPEERFFLYAEAMLEEREFFIRKAIGWVLREVGKRDPDRVYGWLAPRAHRASGVTVREAVKYLEPGQREELLAGYAARR
jgi:3-methyladenine DNA glycosylase AlkD